MNAFLGTVNAFVNRARALPRTVTLAAIWAHHLTTTFGGIMAKLLTFEAPMRHVNDRIYCNDCTMYIVYLNCCELLFLFLVNIL